MTPECTPSGAEAVDALRTDPTLRALDLRGVALDADALARIVEAALEHPAILSLRLPAPPPPDLGARLVRHLAHNRNAAPLALDEHLRATGRAPRPAPPPAPPPPLVWPDASAIAQADAMLRALESLPIGHPDAPDGVDALRRRCLRLADASRRHARRELRLQRSLAHLRDRRRAERAGIRGGAPPTDDEPVAFERARHCYVCKQPFRELDAFYDRLCPRCAAENRARRDDTADLRGRVALVTGARVRIGFRTGLKLLRAGATVVATTRFPHDAWRRFAAEPDFDAWRERLEVHRLDLRFLLDVERFAAQLSARFDRLDVLVSNAAQTVARPAAWHAEMARLDAEAARSLPPGVAPVAPPAALPSDGLSPLVLPGGASGALDRDGQPADDRAHNSWRAVVGEVSTPELVSVHAVTALAPFVLLNALRPLLARSPAADRFAVLVSAVEGQFARAGKTPRHPHTNMAKAALHMLVRTAADDLARDRIWCCAVDPGWVSAQNPAPMAEAMEADGFAPPLDADDAAARVLDPVFRVLRGAAPLHGVFVKDYAPAPW